MKTNKLGLVWYNFVFWNSVNKKECMFQLAYLYKQKTIKKKKYKSTLLMEKNDQKKKKT